MIRQKKKLNIIKLTIVVIIASVLTFIISPVINNSNKPIYKAEFSLSTPPAFMAGSSWLFFVDYLAIENKFEDMTKFMNIKFMEDIDSNPCIKVSSFQNRLSIVTTNFLDSETLKVVIISDQKKILNNCYEYAKAVLLEVERQQKDYLQTKYNFRTSQYNYTEAVNELPKGMSTNNYTEAVNELPKGMGTNNYLIYKLMKLNLDNEKNIITKLNFDQLLLNKSLYSISPLVLTNIKFYSNRFLYPTLFVIIIFLLGLIVYFKEAISHLKKVPRLK